MSKAEDVVNTMIDACNRKDIEGVASINRDIRDRNDEPALAEV